MIKYIIKVFYEGEYMYYAGKHYEASGITSRNIYSATQFSDAVERDNMLESLRHKFMMVTFTPAMIKVIIQEVTMK